MAHPPIVLPPTAIVTAPVGPVPAMARPRRLPVTVMLALAMTFPKNVAESMVAELPICQYTLQGFAEPTTFEVLMVVSVLPVRKTKTPVPVGSLRVRTPPAGKRAAPVTKV
jgi:hypothetical protein